MTIQAIAKTLILTCLVSPLASWAGPSLETYSAEEPNLEAVKELKAIEPIQVKIDVQEIIKKEKQALRQEIRSKKKAKIARKKPHTPAKRAAVRKKAAKLDSIEKFEPVRSEHIASLARRIKIVERLLTHHGRAYDYRALSLKDLEKILATVEGNSSDFQLED